MMRPLHRSVLLASAVSLVLAACASGGGRSARPPAEYTALPDTTVCVVDRASDQGLRDLQAKRDAGGSAVLWTGGAVQPLERIHAVSLVAGYGGSEPWFTRGEPIAFRGSRFTKVESGRRIPLEALARIGEHQGILLFADPKDDPPPEAIYVPVRPGCIFQAYVREDLLRGP